MDERPREVTDEDVALVLWVVFYGLIAIGFAIGMLSLAMRGVS